MTPTYPSEAPTRPLRGAAPDRSRRLGWRAWVRRVLVGSVVMAVLIVGLTAFGVWTVARIDDRRPVDAVVVLGAAQYDGDPSSIFAARLRQARELYVEGLAPRIVTTGGRQPGDEYTEAEAGKNFLVERGVPADAVIAVAEGSDTLSSLQAVAARAKQDGWHSTLLVSDPWHSLRARTMARDVGLAAWASPTRSGPAVQTRETQLRYIVRETGALLFYRLMHASVDAVTTELG